MQAKANSLDYKWYILHTEAGSSPRQGNWNDDNVPSFDGLYCQSLQCEAKTARKNGRPSRQSQRCQQGNAIGMQSAQLPWQKGCRLTCLRKTFLPFGREGAGKGSSRQKATRVCPRKTSLNKKGITHSGAGWCKTWALARPTD